MMKPLSLVVEKRSRGLYKNKTSNYSRLPIITARYNGQWRRTCQAVLVQKMRSTSNPAPHTPLARLGVALGLHATNGNLKDEMYDPCMSHPPIAARLLEIIMGPFAFSMIPGLLACPEHRARGGQAWSRFSRAGHAGSTNPPAKDPADSIETRWNLTCEEIRWNAQHWPALTPLHDKSVTCHTHVSRLNAAKGPHRGSDFCLS